MNDINNALEELKRSLEKVDSARQQSENTVKAYSDLQNEVAEYISQFTDIAGELESVKKLLDEGMQAIDSQGKDILNKLSTKCSILVSDLQIKLSEETQKFQDFSNKEINKIIDTEKNLEKKISELTVLHNNIQRTLKAMDDLGTKFDNWKNLSENNVSEIKMILSEIKSSLLSLESSINNGVQSLKKDISFVENALNKIITASNKKFMWIGIAIIVMVLVDIILHFIL